MYFQESSQEFRHVPESMCGFVFGIDLENWSFQRFFMFHPPKLHRGHQQPDIPTQGNEGERQTNSIYEFCLLIAK